ncbi:hypothetical protein [Jannaschia seohaensis]|uniref:Uncharacterized protein n=1 Tax=Jannaschia seohaensis TaxID=475081 RepID=A0A2Y9ADV2_9RHOB|nr:hypothetical protein [Jannaschia seohaensis]PWJ21028.1 hypothetical protein BCF38_102276 [Jannaschia seohaensis]SSA41438.1 hypothetical protein SAMN05421539_102276 [Jannaschia seohaensis]
MPSKAVDAVWHLHLTHTRDHWQRFVPQALGGRDVHHEPGAPAGHSADYSDTLRRYEREFGEGPPKGIWARSGRVGGWVGLLFGGAWTAAWVGGVLAAGQSLVALLGGAVGLWIVLASLGRAMPSLGPAPRVG